MRLFESEEKEKKKAPKYSSFLRDTAATIIPGPGQESSNNASNDAVGEDESVTVTDPGMNDNSHMKAGSGVCFKVFCKPCPFAHSADFMLHKVPSDSTLWVCSAQACIASGHVLKWLLVNT